MSSQQIFDVIRAWRSETARLADESGTRYVQVFADRSFIADANHLHAHSQICSTTQIPDEVWSEFKSQRAWFEEYECCLLCQYLQDELKDQSRIVCENKDFVALVPFWASGPFETLILSRSHFAGLQDLSNERGMALADLIRTLTGRYDRVFGPCYQYTMGFHQAPTDGQKHEEWHFHAHFNLIKCSEKRRTTDVESLAIPHIDITPEAAANRLREV